MKTLVSASMVISLSVAASLLFGGVSCGNVSTQDVYGSCEAGRVCGEVCLDLDQDPMTECTLSKICQDSVDSNSGCQAVNRADGTSSCGICKPNATVVNASLQTPGTCPTVVHHSSPPYETPGCWFNWCLPWPADDVCWHDCWIGCHIEGTCYSTDEWDEVVYVPEPFYGGCP